MQIASIAFSFSSGAEFLIPAAGSHKIAGCPRFPGMLTLLFLFLALGSRTAQTAGADSPAEIVLGMSTVLTGASADLGKDMQRGILTGLGRVNRSGGVNGRTLRLIALDDGYLPARTAVNMRQLIEKDGMERMRRAPNLSDCAGIQI
jgi:ABC-type branched-subunit amino acid transport system substrate-binding protein